MRSSRFGCLVVTILASVFVASQNNPVPYINQPLAPMSAAPGGPRFALTVNGDGFVAGSTVNWNGQPRSTDYLSSRKLTALISANDIAVAATATVTVTNPAPGGGISNDMYFDVSSPASDLVFFDAYSALGAGYSFMTADFNGDGILDLAFGGYSHNMLVALGTGDGFLPPLSYTGGSEPLQLIAGDFNGDGKVDIAAANGDDNNVSVFLGNGDGTFQNEHTFATAEFGFALAAGDFNNDGKLDLAVGCNGGAVSILLGNGDGTFQPHVDYSPGTGATGNAMAMGDFNGDGKLDVAFIDGEMGKLFILLGNGDGTFHFNRGVPEVPGAVQMVAVDVNGDGKLDLVVNQDEQSGQVAVLLGNGDATFQLNGEYPTGGANPQQVVVGDFNADGILDLAASNANSNTIGILLGQPDGTFQGPTIFDTDGNPAPLAVGDFNNDGRTDLAALVSNTSNSLLLMLQGNIVVKPVVMFSPTSLTFPTQLVYTESQPREVTLTNTGLAPLQILGEKLTGQFRATTTCGGIIPPESGCTISVTFKPIAKGVLDGDIIVRDNVRGTPQEVPLVGMGTYVQLRPTSLNFGTQPVNTTSLPKYLTFTNKGGGTVNFTGSGITITGADAEDFAETNNCGTSVASGASCNIKITFTPLQSGKRAADVSFSDDGGGSPQTTTLLGTGTP